MNKTIMALSLAVVFSMPVMSATEMVSSRENNHREVGLQDPNYGQVLITSVKAVKEEASDDEKVVLKGKLKVR